MKQNYSDDFIIVRHYVWYNFVAADCPIRREALDVQDVVALINDIGKDWQDKSKRGYAEVPPMNDAVRDLRYLVQLLACGDLASWTPKGAELAGALTKEGKRISEKYGFSITWEDRDA